VVQQETSQVQVRLKDIVVLGEHNMEVAHLLILLEAAEELAQLDTQTHLIQSAEQAAMVPQTILAELQQFILLEVPDMVMVLIKLEVRQEKVATQIQQHPGVEI
jgi:hypothetical protein